MANHPTCNALLVCDMAIRDADTGKTSLIGIFETIHAPRFPALVPWIVLYAKVSDVEGTQGDSDDRIRVRQLMDRNQLEGVIVTVKPAGVLDLNVREGVKVFGNCTIITTRLTPPEPGREHASIPPVQPDSDARA